MVVFAACVIWAVAGIFVIAACWFHVEAAVAHKESRTTILEEWKKSTARYRRHLALKEQVRLGIQLKE